MARKCVMVIDGGLPAGLAANAAAIMGVTLGKRLPEIVGIDVRDGRGREHPGIVEFPIPVLRGTPESLRALRARLWEPDFQDLTAVDFSDVAQSCRTYAEFIDKMRRVPEEELRYLGLALCGAGKKVDRLTGSLPLLR